jgi:peroxiredoxin Q/BCP
LGGEIIGVSADAMEAQCSFAEALELPFPLIPDPERKIIDLYDAGWLLFKVAKRVTFIIDREGRIASFHQHEVLISRHSADVLSALQKLQPA